MLLAKKFPSCRVMLVDKYKTVKREIYDATKSRKIRSHLDVSIAIGGSFFN